MNKLLLLGDEAVAQGAMDAGISGIYAYPGTPSTEIMEYVQQSIPGKSGVIHSEWSANEKTAYEEALGMSYCGKRALVCMKHVGLNVAADPFINSAITGVNGGLVLAVADDPSMHSSQNEQDSRYYGKFAMIPVLEPADQQEAYEMVLSAFNLSEKLLIPVLIRLTTRLSHSRAGVLKKESNPQKELQFPSEPQRFILLPAIARNQYKKLLSLQNQIYSEAENSVFNQYYPGSDHSVGIITGGIAYNYLKENFIEKDCPYPVLKIGQYPLPKVLIRKIYNECNKIFVFEDGYPFIEEQLTGILSDALKINGRLDGTLPRDGEMTPDIIASAIGIIKKVIYKVPSVVVNRPPSLCKGCSHIDLFEALNLAIEHFPDGRIFSDIGCYTLGALEPFNSIHSCVDMGASITMAKGASDAGMRPSVAVIGDSTFTHSGMTGLLDAVNENTPATIIISDNSSTAMTGGQPSPGTGRLTDICTGLGVNKKHIIILNPLKKHLQKNAEIIKNELEYKGLSVIISQRECIQTAGRKKKLEKQSE